MLSLTEEGENTAYQLHHKPNQSNEELAFMAAADFVSNYVVMDAYALANMIPFVHDHRQKSELVDDWIERGLIEK